MAFKIPNFYSKSPLHGSYYNPKGETYISEVGMIQDAANAVSKAAMDIENASAESKAKRQGKRVEKRNKRGVRKGEGTIDETTGEYTAIDAESKFNQKTKKIKDKASKNRTIASEEKEAQRKRDYDTMTDAEYKKKYGVDKPPTNSNTTSNIFK